MSNVVVNIKDRVFELKKEFVKQFATNDNIAADSIFLIGSCAGKEDGFDDWYQDFDIHVLFNKPFISTKELEEIGKRFELIKNKFSSEDILVEWNIKDRHWKQIPNYKYKLNLSIHGTIANSFDLYRRIKINPILGWNMYQICEPLFGNPPATYHDLNKPTVLDLFHSVGGVGWMIENFYRTLWFYFNDPINQSFYPYIQAYCWNVPSSIMLQYYLAKNGYPGTRKEALKFLLSDKTFPDELKKDLNFIVEHKRNSENNLVLHKQLINASYAVSSWLTREMKRIYNIKTISRKDNLLSKKTLFKKIIAESLGNDKKVEELHFYVNFNEKDFFESFKEKVQFINKNYKNSSCAEFPEFLKDFIHNKQENASKIYLWNDLNILRFNLSHDFYESKGYKTYTSIFWGWEKGTQSLLQRLNEYYILAKDKKDSNLLTISKVFYKISFANIKKLNYSNSDFIKTDNFEEVLKEMSDLNKNNLLL